MKVSSLPTQGPVPTHAELVKRAARWLRSNGHGVVLTELVTLAWETPDAIGWKGGHSTLVECKCSRADFLRDAKKPFRRDPEKGVGSWRYYLCPPDIIKPDDLPDGWGLLHTTLRGVRVIHKPERAGGFRPPFYPPNLHCEVLILTSALRRHQGGRDRRIQGDDK